MSVFLTDPTTIYGIRDAGKSMDTGKNPKKMKNQNPTPQLLSSLREMKKTSFLKGVERIICSDLANILGDYSLEEIEKARIIVTTDEKKRTLTIRFEFPTA